MPDPGNTLATTLSALLGISPALTLVLGLVHVVAGRRCWAGLLGIYGFVFMAIVGASAADAWFPGHAQARQLMQVGAGLGGLGAVVLFHRVGVFVLGALAGAVVGELAGTALGTGVSDPVLLLAAMIGGSLSVALTRGAIIVATSVTGAALCIRSVMAIGHGPAAWALGGLDLWAWPTPDAGLFVELAILAVLAGVGVAIQRRA